MENNKKPSIDEVLGRQALEILKTAGIHNLRVENDSSISGERSTVRGLPVVDTLRNIKILIKNDRIIVDGDITDTYTDLGKVF